MIGINGVNIGFAFTSDMVMARIGTSSCYDRNYRFKVTVSAQCPAAEINRIIKEQKTSGTRTRKLYPVASLLQMYLRMSYGLNLSAPTLSIDSRAKNGTVGIHLEYLFGDPAYAYQLGLNLVESFGSSTLLTLDDQKLRSRSKVLDRVQDVKVFGSNLELKIAMEMSVTGQSRESLWKSKYQPIWAAELDKLRQTGISYTEFR